MISFVFFDFVSIWSDLLKKKRMIIWCRDLQIGDMFLAETIGIPPIHPQNAKFDLYFVLDVKQEGSIAKAWYILKVFRLNHRGFAEIIDISFDRSEIFSKLCIPFRFQEMGLSLHDHIPKYSEQIRHAD